MLTKKKNAVFGRYPCCDMVNNAIRYILNGHNEDAVEELLQVIQKANGYLHEDLEKYFQDKHDKEIPEPDSLPSGCMYCRQYNGRGCSLTGIQFWSEMNVAVRPKGCPLVSAK